jgi:hypothetical protein
MRWLNVKIWRLGIFEIYGFIFLLKIPWNRPPDRRTGCTAPAHGSTDRSLNNARQIRDLRSRYNIVKRYFPVLILDVPSRMDGQEWTSTQKKWTSGTGALDTVATIATSREPRPAHPMTVGFGAWGDRNGDEHEGILTGLFTELGKTSR